MPVQPRLVGERWYADEEYNNGCFGLQKHIQRLAAMVRLEHLQENKEGMGKVAAVRQTRRGSGPTLCRAAAELHHHAGPMALAHIATAARALPHRRQHLSDGCKQASHDAVAPVGPAALAPRLPGPCRLLPGSGGAAARAAITGRLSPQACDCQAGRQQQAVKQCSS